MASAPLDITESLPFAPDAERGVLSCFLHNPSALLPDAQNTIPEEAFYHTANRMLFNVMLEFHQDERPVEYIAISQHLQDKGLMEKMGGQGSLAELLDFVPTPTHYGYYKGILLDKLLLRRIIGVCTESVQDAYEYQENVPALLEKVYDRIYALTKQQQGKAHKSFREHLDTFVEDWERQARGERQAGIPTRWPSFNAIYGGLLPDMWLVAGYPSEGKSCVAQNLVEDTLAHGKHVLLFSFEMDEISLIKRLITAKTCLNSKRVFFPQNGIRRDEITKIIAAIEHMQDWGLHLRCEDWCYEQVISESRAMCLKYPIGLIAIDYLQLLHCRQKFDTRAAEVSHISRGLKRLSTALGVPVLVLSQLNDEGKTLESRAPTQDAANVVSIETARTEFKGGKKIEHKAGLRVVKNRNGERGPLLPIVLNGPTFTFQEAQEEQTPDLPQTPAHKSEDWD